MSKYSRSLLFLCSLAMGGALFFFSLRLLSQSGRGGPGAYAALGLEGAEGEFADREVAGALEKALGRPVISASSQWVLLNSFGGLERIPLEGYGDRLEIFDPRRDGYAEKLTRFFVRDGKRWFFIPLDRKIPGSPPALNPAESLAFHQAKRLKTKIAGALDPVLGSGISGAAGVPGVPFTLELPPRDRTAGFRVLLFILAWGSALVLPLVSSLVSSREGGGAAFAGPGPDNSRQGSRRGPFRGPFTGLSPALRRLLLLAPAMLPLSLWGAPGFAALALFLFLGILLGDPLKEWWIRLLDSGARRPLRRGPYRLRVLFSLPLAVFLVLIPWIGGMPLLCFFLNLLGLALLCLCSLGLEIRRNFPFPPGLPRGKAPPYGPCRFVPLPILSFRFSGGFPVPAVPVIPAGGNSRGSRKSGRRERLGGLNFFPGGKGAGLMLPFAFASCLAAFFPGGEFPFPPAPPPLERPSLIREEDYLAHALFQAGFSYRPLEFQEGDAEPGYFRYVLGEDGLVAGVFPAGGETPEALAIPPFPLADLSDFLSARYSPDGGERKGLSVGGSPADLVFPLLVFLLAFPSFLGRARGRKKLSPLYDKRIAA